jgi:hypothetical protein
MRSKYDKADHSPSIGGLLMSGRRPKSDSGEPDL